MRISDWSSDVCSSDLAPTILDKLQADGCRQVALSSARRAEQDEIGALFQPSVARGHGRDLRPRDHRHGVEGEAVERFARRSEEHTSELQSTNAHLVCRLLLEKKKHE